jgi:O-antigen/teichoic acid export membrane protein
MSVRGAALWSMSGQYIVFAAQFVVSVLISRFFLTPAEVGLFSIALSAAMLVSVFQDFGITRYIAGERGLTDAQIRTCFSVSALFAGAVGLVILALAWPVADFYDDARLTPLLAVVALSYLMVPFGIVPSAVLQRRMDFRSLFIVNVGAASANAIVALSLAWMGWSSMALAWAAVAQQGARALIGAWRSGWRSPFPLSLAGAGPIMRFGGGTSLLYVSGAVGTRTPELIIGRLLDFTAVGLYGRAASLAGQMVTLVSGAIGAVFYPAFARMRDRGDDLAEPYLRVVAGYSATTWPAMAFLAAAATPLVLMLYGPVWAGVAPLLVWIALSEIAFTALPLHMEIPIILGRMRTLLGLNILDTVASIGLLLVAAAWSLEWAAASRVAYGIVWFALYAAFMRRLVGFRWAPMLVLYARSIAVSIATAAPLIAVYALGIEPADVDLPLLAACTAAGGLCWLASLFLVRHPARHELLGMLETLRSALPRPA